jgi:hypothetical protein
MPIIRRHCLHRRKRAPGGFHRMWLRFHEYFLMPGPGTSLKCATSKSSRGVGFNDGVRRNSIFGLRRPDRFAILRKSNFVALVRTAGETERASAPAALAVCDQLLILR